MNDTDFYQLFLQRLGEVTLQVEAIKIFSGFSVIHKQLV